MVWKSNIVPVVNENDSIEEVCSPKGLEDKENRNTEGKDSSVTIDARTSENFNNLEYDDDVIEV
jgi:hypothetical protein